MKVPELDADLLAGRLYKFGDFRLDAAKRLLWRGDGTLVPLTPKVFETLLYLVQHSGAILDKERLMAAVWPDAIVEENNLTQNISALRRVFGEKPGSHDYIVTVPGRGYRFVAEVNPLPEELAADRPQSAIGSASPVRRGTATVGDTSIAPWFPRTIAVAALLLLALCVTAIVIWRSLPQKRIAAASVSEKGIAVLPFENLSPDNADDFFADGIQDDLLTTLGKIKNLRVIGRASVMDFRGPRVAGRVREIGAALGVSHVLYGSMRRHGDRVVVNVALVDTNDERQLWSERYERTLTDMLSLQGELAVEIAGALHATLSPGEKIAAAARLTNNADAYLLYLRARETEFASQTAEATEAAIKLYQQVIDVDPSFALARARLSICASDLFRRGNEPQWKAKARAEAEAALRLRPDLGEAHLAMSFFHLWVENAYDRALQELARAAELLPNSAEVPLTAAYIYKQQNRYVDRITALRRAETLDPRNVKVLAFLTLTFRWLRDWPEAVRTLDRFAAFRPNDPSRPVAWRRAQDEFRRTGDIETLKHAIAREVEARAPSYPEWLHVARYETAILERDYPAAARFLAAASSEALEQAAWPNPSPHLKIFHDALLAVATSRDDAATRRTLERAQSEQAARLASGANDSLRAQKQADLALLYAFAGRKEEAIRQALGATEAEAGPAGPIEKHDMQAALALVYAQAGESDKAIDLIEHLLTVPLNLQRGAVYNMTVTDLKWRWVWDPLRSHPRFQKLLAGPEPKTVY